MQRKIWSKEDEQILVQNYPICTIEELVILLKTSKAKIRQKAQKMHLRKTDDFKQNILAHIAHKNICKMHTEEARKKRKTTLANIIKSERLRIKYGLPQRTNRVFSMLTAKENMAEIRRRYELRKRGYVVLLNGRTVLYDAATKRSDRKESNLTKLGYEFIARDAYKGDLTAMTNDNKPSMII